MNHDLVPEIILRNVAQGHLTGHFHAVCLFVDLSGFTSLTSALMQHGGEGAEVIAEVVNAVFAPLIEIVYKYAGFVAAFAGDAFMAVFPTQSAQAYERATVTAWQISQAIVRTPQQSTRFGLFNFAIKVSLADGLVEWGVWRQAPHEPAQEAPSNEQKAVYFFIGEALTRCLEADRFAVAGAVVMTEPVYNQLPPTWVTVEPLAQYRRLRWLAETLADDTCRPEPGVVVPDPQLVAPFFPRDLLQRQTLAELRQVAMLFVNLQKLPTGGEAEEFQQTLFQLLGHYGGYLSLVGYIGNPDLGCTLVLFWGAPTSYENNLRRALRFALELRNRTTIPLRASVVFNLVYAGFVGSLRRKAYSCYGAYVNLAARQLVMASWGEILLDAITAHEAQVEFSARPKGWYAFKGFAENRQVFTLEPSDEAQTPAFSGSVLVGRHRELAQLGQAVQTIFAGKFGGTVMIIGDTGIGKSRLIHEFRNHLYRANALYPPDEPSSGTPAIGAFAWFTCRTDEIIRQPLHPFTHWLRSYFHQAASASEAVNKQRFNEQLADLVATTAEPALAAELTRLQPFLGELLGLRWEASLYQQLTPALRLDNTLDALKTLLKAISLRQPLIFCIEDTQWLDAKSKLFLERLTRNVEDFPFVLLMTTRPPPPDWTPQVTRQTTIQLTPLAKNDLYLLATYQLGGAVTPALIDLLDKRATGNPFFAEQILLYWQEHELLSWGDQGWQFQLNSRVWYDGSKSPLSANIRTMLTAHLDRLPQAVKEVVQTAAVLGAEFDSQVLAHMLDYNAALPTHLVMAEQARIWSMLEPSRYLFRHVLLRDDAYEMQLRTQLRHLHYKAAEAIQEVYGTDLTQHYADLAHHYQQSGNPTQERHYAQLAGDQAAERYANDDAIQYFSQALALAEPTALAERYSLLLKREAIYNLLGQRAEQQQDLAHLAALVPMLPDRQAALTVLLRQAYYERVIGNYAAALAVVQQVVAQAVPLRARTHEVQAYHAWGRILSQQGQHAAARGPLTQALTMARAIHSRLDEADSLYDMGHLAYARGQHGEATQQYTQAHTLYQAIGNAQGEINCLLMFGALANERGDYTAAHQYYEQTIARSRAIGWRYAEASGLTNLGNNYFDFGHYRAAYSCHYQALALCREIGDQEGAAISLDTLGLIWQSLGKATQARQYFEQALQIQRQIGDLHGEGFTLTHLGYTLYTLGHLEAAADAFQAAGQLRYALGEESHTLDDLTGLALIAFTQADLECAIQAIERILAWLQANGNEGIEFPILVYLICHHVLHSATQWKPIYLHRTLATLQEGYTLLQQRAAKIQDVNLQRAFLEDVWFNRELITRWEQTSAQRSLPRSEKPMP